jgi:hypothetical protein
VLAKAFSFLIFCAHLMFSRRKQATLPAPLAPHAIFSIGFGAVALSVFPPLVSAAEWFMAPAVSLSYELHDNIRMTLQPHDTVHGSVIAPRLNMGVQSEVWAITGLAEIARKRYSGEPDLDRDFETFRLSSRYRMERGSFTLNASRVNDATISGDQADIDVGRTTAQKSRRTETIQPAWNWSISERAELQLSYLLSETSYADGESSGLYGYQNRTATATWSYMLSPRSRFFLTANYSRFRVPERDLVSQIPASLPLFFTAIASVDSKTPGYRMGIDHVFSETMRGSLALGRRKTESERNEYSCILDLFNNQYVCFLDQRETHDSGTTFSGDLKKQFENLDVTATISRDIAASGAGTEIEWDSLSLRFDRPFTARLNGALTVSGSESRHIADVVSATTDIKQYSIQPSLHWQWTREADLGVSYRYWHLSREGESQSVQSHTLYLSLVYTWNKFSISR